MLRYVAPAGIFVAAVALILAGLFLWEPDAPIGSRVLTIGVCAYGAALLWWLLRATRPDGPAWLHLLALWFPALPLAALTARAARAMSADDTSAIALSLYAPATAGMLLLCLVFVSVMILRRMDRRDP